MKYILLLLNLFIILSCTKEDSSLTSLVKIDTSFKTQRLTSLQNGFQIDAPVPWEWKHLENLAFDNVEIQSPKNKSGLKNILSITKILSQNKSLTLEEEFNWHLSRVKKQDWKIIDAGKTGHFTYPAYFIHYTSGNNEENMSETITVLMEAEGTGSFYLLFASTPPSEKRKADLAIMLKSLQTFIIK